VAGLDGSKKNDIEGKYTGKNYSVSQTRVPLCPETPRLSSQRRKYEKTQTTAAQENVRLLDPELLNA